MGSDASVGDGAMGVGPRGASWDRMRTKLSGGGLGVVDRLIDCYSLDRTLEIYGAANTNTGKVGWLRQM